MAIIAILAGLVAAVLVLVVVRPGAPSEPRIPKPRDRDRFVEPQMRQSTQDNRRWRRERDEQVTETGEPSPSMARPLMARPESSNRLLTSLDLSDFDNSGSHHRDLRSLLDKIATAGSFSAVFVSDDEGRPVAFTRTQENLERLAATSTRLMSVATQACNDAAGPLAIMLRDTSGMTMLCRIFKARGQDLSLTIVGEDVLLTPLTLDQAVDKIVSVLTSKGEVT